MERDLLHNHRDEQSITGQHRPVIVGDPAKRRASHDAQLRIAASIMAEAKAVADLMQHERHALRFVQQFPARPIDPDQALPRCVDVCLCPDAEVVLGDFHGDYGSDRDAPHKQNQGDKCGHVAPFRRAERPVRESLGPESSQPLQDAEADTISQMTRCPDGEVRAAGGMAPEQLGRPGAAQIVGRGRTPRNLAPTLPAM